MYLGGIPEHPDTTSIPWSQSLLDARWAEIGQPPPAPILPASMTGMYTVVTRQLRRLAARPGDRKGSRNLTKEENKFLNFWNTVAADPYRKQSGISKAAGAVLSVAGAVLAPLGVMQAVTTAGNTALEMDKAKELEKQAVEILTPAIEKQEAEKEAAIEAATAAQIEAMQVLRPNAASLAPVAAPAVTSLAPASNTLIVAPVSSKAPAPQTPKKILGMSAQELAIAGAATFLLLLGAMRK